MAGCSSKKKKPYQYPNYDIIKPKKIYKAKRKNIKKLVKSHLGKPYVWAEEGPDAFDCSGLTYSVYGSIGIDIPRVSREQAKVGKSIDLYELDYGDLIFFGSSNPESSYINHVGIYLGEGKFAHANSANRKVMLGNLLEEQYYLQRIKECKRYLSKDEKQKYLTHNVPLAKMKTMQREDTAAWQKGMSLPLKAVP